MKEFVKTTITICIMLTLTFAIYETLVYLDSPKPETTFVGQLLEKY